MSDEEGGGKKSGYRLEYASSARAKCKGAISRFTFFFPFLFSTPFDFVLILTSKYVNLYSWHRSMGFTNFFLSLIRSQTMCR